MNNKLIKTIIISRTDAIGDVVLTLPIATILKKILGTDTKIIFFGRTYTFPVINCCSSVDKFINYDTFHKFNEAEQKEFLKELNADTIIHVFPRKDIARAAKAAGIKKRIGTTNRLYHWTTCNELVPLGRKNSELHEAQLNVKLLKPLGHSGTITLNELNDLYSFSNLPEAPETITKLLSQDKFKLILHPKSHASGREWKLSSYRDLIRFLPFQKFQFIITGGEKEKEILDEWIKELPSGVLNLAGKISLEELIALINKCDGLIASGTGPLHISSALGKHTLGIFPPIRPIHPGRWAPVGKKAEFMVSDKNCSQCKHEPQTCLCINEISAEKVAERILEWSDVRR